PDGRLLALAGDSGVAVYDTTDGHRHLLVRGDVAKVITFSPDGRWLAFNDAHADLVRIWSVGAGREVAVLRSPGPLAQLEFRADGSALYAVGGLPASATVWDLAGPGEKRRLAGHEMGVPGVTFSPDGRFLASGSNDRTARVW